MFKRYLAVSLAILTIFTGSSAHAVVEDGTFLSLTRNDTSVSKLPTNISVLTADQIQQTGANNLAEVLDLLPAVDVQRSGQLGTLSTVRMRGVPTSNQVQIIVDDQPLGGVSIQDVNTGLIPIDNIERIEVVRGSSPMLYGANTIGGVIHIITKKTVEPEVSLGFEGRSYNTKINTARIGGAAGNLKYLVTGNHYETEGYMQRNSDANDTSTTSSFDYNFANGSVVGLDADFTRHNVGNFNGTPVDFDNWDGKKERRPNSDTQRVENEISKVRLNGSTPLGGSAQLKTTLYNSNESYRLKLSKNSDPFASYDNKIIGGDARMLMTTGLVVGAAYERDERASLGQMDQHITNWGLYAQDEFSISRLSILPALRFDQHSSFGNELNPRLTLVYNAMDNWKLSANAARSFRAPTLVDLYIVAQDPFFPAFDFFGNPNLQPETAWTYDLGTEFKPCSHSRIAITGYHTDISDRITAVDTDGNGNDDTYRNLSKAQLNGVEVEGSWDLWFMRHEGNFTVQRAKGSSATSSDFVSLRLTPRYLANYRFIANAPFGGRFINTVQYVDHQFRFDGDKGFKLPAYLLWHMRVEQKVKNLTLFAGVNNLTDQLYAETFSFGRPSPMATRNYSAGASITFR